MSGIYIPMKLPEIEGNKGIKAQIRQLDGKLELGILTGGYYCCEQWSYYPIIRVTEHGDLIDRDKLRERSIEVYDPLGILTAVDVEDIDNAEAVIPANKEEQP